MTASYTKKMTEGSEIKHIIMFTLPLLFGNVFQQLYNIVDSIIVGKYLGSDALAAVGATGSITYFFYTFCIGLATGIGILISQSYGANEIKKVKKIISNSAYAVIGLGLAITIISVLLTPYVLKLLNVPESIYPVSVGYMKIACGGTIAVAAYNWINAIMRSLGDSKTPLIFLIVASILNVALDLLFVCVFEMGVNGAAIATVMAQAISAVSCIIFAVIKNPLLRLKKEDIIPEMGIIKKCYTTGIPIALQNAIISISMIYLSRTANGFGEDIMATYTATMRVEQLVQQPFASLGSAISTFSGQNIGAGKRERAIKGYKDGMKIGIAFALIMLILFYFFGNNIIQLFVDNENIIATGAKALMLSACFYIPLGTIHITRGLLNGAGDVGYALTNGICEVVGRIGFAIILVPFLDCWAIWTTSCLTWVLTAVMSLIRYFGGKWKNKSEYTIKG